MILGRQEIFDGLIDGMMMRWSKGGVMEIGVRTLNNSESVTVLHLSSNREQSREKTNNEELGSI